MFGCTCPALGRQAVSIAEGVIAAFIHFNDIIRVHSWDGASVPKVRDALFYDDVVGLSQFKFGVFGSVGVFIAHKTDFANEGPRARAADIALPKCSGQRQVGRRIIE